MAKAKRICKVCGAEYEGCRTAKTNGVFRYQDVACCREHGSIYLQRILDSRSGKASIHDDKEPSED